MPTHLDAPELIKLLRTFPELEPLLECSRFFSRRLIRAPKDAKILKHSSYLDREKTIQIMEGDLKKIKPSVSFSRRAKCKMNAIL